MQRDPGGMKHTTAIGTAVNNFLEREQAYRARATDIVEES